MRPAGKKDERLTRQKNQDIIIALLCYFAMARIDKIRLYTVNEIFGGFLKRYKEKSHEELAFYRDVVTRVYKELAGIFEDIMYLGFIRPISSHGDVQFDICITPSMAQRLLSDIPEADIIKEIFPSFLDAYRTGKWNSEQDSEDEEDLD